jgi:hypothetical protein
MIESEDDLPENLISDDQRRALLFQLHQSIVQSVDAAIGAITDPDSLCLSYPPDGPELTTNLTAEEKEALRGLRHSPQSISALKKILTDACAGPPFQFFCLLDGVSDPDIVEIPQWVGAHLVERNGDAEFLHDMFYETFWDYKEKTGHH